MSWIVELCSVCHKRMRNWYEFRGHVETCGHKTFKLPEKEMTLTEQVFRKMLWTRKEDFNLNKYVWLDPEGNSYDELPDIDDEWEVTAKWLVAFMRGKECGYAVTPVDDIEVFAWGDFKSSGVPGMEDVFYFNPIKQVEIKDDNIAEAACKAFMEVEL